MPQFHLSNLVGSPHLSSTDIVELNAYHCPAGKEQNFAKVREAAVNFMETLVEECPTCADRTRALQCIREARMWANSAIALDGVEAGK
jgi:hypothetical protein